VLIKDIRTLKLSVLLAENAELRASPPKEVKSQDVV
jgi:hypothetical protein